MRFIETTNNRPIPILKGKATERFLEEITDKEISKEQEKFLKKCVKLLGEK